MYVFEQDTIRHMTKVDWYIANTYGIPYMEDDRIKSYVAYGILYLVEDLECEE